MSSADEVRAILQGDPDLAVAVVDGLRVARPWWKREQLVRSGVREEWERRDLAGAELADVYEFMGSYSWMATGGSGERFGTREDAMIAADAYLHSLGVALASGMRWRQ